MPTLKQFDLVIVGGGIAGLWTLAEARARGLNAILVERDSLGAGQTLCSQGIIHGGSKYALQAKITQATTSIAAMPKIWLDAFAAKGNIDLSQAKLLAEKQYLIPSASIDSKILSFFGSKTMASQSKRLAIHEAPQAYQNLQLSGSIFELNEPVFDVASVLQCLQAQYKAYIYRAELRAEDMQAEAAGYRLRFGEQECFAHKVLIAAGEGFASLHIPKPAMQTRPLHMLIAKADNLPAIYAHFIGRSAKPLLTITSHPSEQGVAWYMGGGIAEDGVNLSATEQSLQAKNLLAQLLPKMNFENMQFESFFINRAEPQQKGLLRPDDAFIEEQGALIIGWPTKLALAPRFAEKALANIQAQAGSAHDEKLDLPATTIAPYPWQH